MLHVSLFRRIKSPVHGGERHPDSHASRQAVCDQLKSTPTRLLIFAGSRILEAPVNPFRVSRARQYRRAYTHKLNCELDTSLAVFNWLPDGRWLRGVELEDSLDYVATGLQRMGDRIDNIRFLDKASPWSFSIVFVIPVAPF